MTCAHVDRLRGRVMFVVAWLIGLYVFEVVSQSFPTSAGWVAAVLTVVVNIYARRKAMACVKPTPMFKFWLYLPVVLFIAVPLGVKLIVFLTSDDDLSWWTHLVSLGPFILKLGVPVGALLWVYWSLGRLESSGTDDTNEEATL